MLRPGEDLLHVEERLWVLTAPTGQGIYDFTFDRFFACRRPYLPPESVEVVARAGAWNDYAERYRELEGQGGAAGALARAAPAGDGAAALVPAPRRPHAAQRLVR